MSRGISAGSQRASGFHVVDRLHRALGDRGQVACGTIVRGLAVGLHLVRWLMRNIVELDVWIGFGRLCVAKFDNGESFEDSTSEPLGATLPRPPTKSTTRAVSLGIAVRADGARSNDDQEEESDEPCDTVQDTHGHGGVVAGLLAILFLLHVSEIAGDSCSCSACGARREVTKLGGGAVVGHGQKLVEIQVLPGQATALALLTVQEDSLWLGTVAHEMVQNLVGVYERVVDLIAAHVRDDVVPADSGIGRSIGQSEFPLYVDSLKRRRSAAGSVRQVRCG